MDAITNKKFVVGRLVQVRDVFVFCCYTGLSYADVKKLRRNEIGIGMDGVYLSGHDHSLQHLKPDNFVH